MEAHDVDTIETILRQHDVDDLLDSVQFSDLLDTLRNRESVMIADALSIQARKMPPAKGDKVELSKILEGYDEVIGTQGEVIAIDTNGKYVYTVRFSTGTVTYVAADEVRKI